MNMFTIAIASSSKLFENTGLFNSWCSYHMAMLCLYSSPMSLSSWPSSLSTLGASRYYNIIVIIILRWSFNEHVCHWCSIFIETIRKCGTIDMWPIVIFVINIIIIAISFSLSLSNSSLSPSIINIINNNINVIFSVINVIISLLLNIYLFTIYFHRSYSMFIIP